MPQVAPVIGAAVAGISASAVAQAVLTLAVTMAIGSYNASRQRKKAAAAERDAFNASLRDRNITIRSGVSTRKYVIGDARVGGTLMHIDTNGWENTALDSVLALACNKSELLSYFIGDEHVALGDFPGTRYGHRELIDHSKTTLMQTTTTVTLDHDPASPDDVKALASGLLPLPIVVNGRDVTVTVPEDGNLYIVKIVYKTLASTRMRAIFKNGDPNQTVDGWPDIETPLWSEDHRLRGVAYLRTLMLWDESIYEGGAPEIGAVLRGGDIDGHPIYDPRTDTYLTHSSNPAIRAAWWMTLPRGRGGMGIPESWIDWPYVSEAANICDELIRVRTVDGEGYEWIKRYECHTVLDTAESPSSNLDIILSAMAGRKVFTAGMYRIFAGAFRPAAVVIRDKDVAGDKDIVVDRSGASETPPNVVTATFIDARKNWQESSPRPVRNESYVTMDGEESPLDMPLAATTDERQANYLMGVALESGRPAFTFTLSVTGIGEDLSIMDTVQIELTNNEVYSGKTFQILDRVDHWDGTFDLVLAEIRPNTYALDPDTFTPTDPVPIPDTSYLWNVLPVSNFVVDPQKPQALADGTAVTRVDMTWDLHPQPYVRQGGRIEIRYRAPDGEWIGVAPVTGDSIGTSFTAALVDGDYYQFQARAVNGVGARSNWTDGWVGYDGVIAPPPALTSLTTTSMVFGIQLSWTFPQTRNAIQRTELRYSDTPTFGDAIPLGDFAYPTNSHNLLKLSAGAELWFWGRLVDQNSSVGPWYPVGTGVYGKSSTDAQEYLSYFNGLIGQDQLAQSLIEQLPSIVGEEWWYEIFGNVAGDTEDTMEWFTGDDETMDRSRVGNRSIWSMITDGDLAQIRRVDTIAAQSGETLAALQHERFVRADADEALVQDILTMGARVDNNQAAIQTERTVRANADSALASDIANVQVQVGQNTAGVQTNATAYANLDGALRAELVMQAQVTDDGKLYAAGMAFGAYKYPGQPVQTSVYFLADRLALLNLVNGVITTPFVIQGGQTFISQALIGTAWIQTGHIENLAVTNGKIANLAVTTAKMVDLAVTNAKMANLAVTTGKIADLAVDTLKIAGNAVTIHGAATAPQEAVSGGTSLRRNVQFVVNVPHAATVTITANLGTVTGNTQLSILRVDGGAVLELPTYSDGTISLSVSRTHIVSVGAGTHTFTIDQGGVPVSTGSSTRFSDASIVALIAMR